MFMCDARVLVSSPGTAAPNVARAYHGLVTGATKSVIRKGGTHDANDLPSTADLHICAASVGT
ncbi:hypothetical protein SPHINGOR109_10306 [Sphingorhabdus sp. 109]|nr:hypothetical protein SPHINGOR109_10306 [Sphingorhabdus sp. 109]